ncbi:hypothetical protein HG530_015057 [Fusarium avenaceum]|nr:hypothetical protein HG530_015057 [Fusarium avenaceum]
MLLLSILLPPTLIALALLLSMSTVDLPDELLLSESTDLGGMILLFMSTDRTDELRLRASIALGGGGLLSRSRDRISKSGSLSISGTFILGNDIADGESPTVSLVSIFEFTVDKGARSLERGFDFVRDPAPLQGAVLVP